MTRNIGAATFRFLIKKYKNPYQIIQNIQKNSKYIIPDDVIIDQCCSKMKQIGAEYILIDDDRYPKMLKQIYDAPAMLFVRGNQEILNQKFIAVVGARNSSIYGNKISYDFAKQITNAGYAIVSGMAKGIDRHAHLGGINRTAAVFGNGLDIVYPKDNEDIYKDIIKNNGLHISECIPGSAPHPQSFPMRNRIIAGMANAIVVVEASKNSGSLLTAKFGLEYNRYIFAVPGCPLDQRSYGCNRLIQEGAYLSQTPADILDELSGLKTHLVQENADYIETNLTALQREILSVISTQETHIDIIAAAVKKSISIVNQILVSMEIDGIVRQIAPCVFQKTTSEGSR